ncbi:MAG: efflux RND transporter periplasmic adaptor subunit [Bryobacteraceae bacterium]
MSLERQSEADALVRSRPARRLSAGGQLILRQGSGAREPREDQGVRPTTAPGLPFLLVVCCLLVSGCAKKEAAEVEGVAAVEVATVTQDSIRRIVEADAVLYPIDQASVMPKISAPVQKFLVNRGDHVRAGQLLAVLENRDLVAAENAAKSQVDQAEANLRSTESATVPEAITKAQTDVASDREQLDAAGRVLESRRKLFQDGALARKSVDDAAVAYAQAKAQFETASEYLRAFENVGKPEQIKTAQAQVAAAQAQYRAAAAQVSYSEILSPIAGVIADRPLYAGEMAAPGGPLLTVMDTSRVVARANIPQALTASIRIGDAAAIRLTNGQTEVPARVTVVSPATDPASTTLQVWAEAANPGEGLKPGASVRLSIVTETIPRAVVIPAAAILPGEEGGDAVLVVSADSTVHRKTIETGSRDGDKVQVLSGVSPGEQVVAAGGVGLDDNSRVRIVKPGAKDEAGEAGGRGAEKE